MKSNEPEFTERALFESYGLDYDKIKDKESPIKDLINDPQTEADITAHFVDKWFHHEITDEELEERFKQHPLSTYEESREFHL